MAGSTVILPYQPTPSPTLVPAASVGSVIVVANPLTVAQYTQLVASVTAAVGGTGGGVQDVSY